VPDTVKQERYDRLMGQQQEISTARLATKVGRTLDVIIDEVDEDGAIARSYADAPEIDGNVFIAPHRSLKPGEFIRAKIEEADEYDLYARVV
jgi:ribosomal protein S12 methylthiotransferase